MLIIDDGSSEAKAWIQARKPLILKLGKAVVADARGPREVRRPVPIRALGVPFRPARSVPAACPVQEPGRGVFERRVASSRGVAPVTRFTAA